MVTGLARGAGGPRDHVTRAVAARRRRDSRVSPPSPASDITNTDSTRPGAFISYQPPDEGQPLRPKGVLGAHRALAAFLERCTDCRAPDSVTLVASEPTSLSPPGYDSGPVIDRLTGAFGVAERRQAEHVAWGNHPLPHAFTWRLPVEDLDRAVSQLSELPTWPAIYAPPVHLSVLFTFALRDPRSGELLPRQGPAWVLDQAYARSWAFLFLHGAPSARIELQLPFDEPGPAFHSYVEAVRPYLPIRLAWSRFRLLVPNARGTGYVRRVVGVRGPRSR